MDNLEQRFRETFKAAERLLVAGNAGGVVATLSLIGTTLGSGATVPRPFFWVLVVFLFGLIISGVGRYLDFVMAHTSHPSSILFYSRRVALMLSTLFVILGIALGLIELYLLTE